MLTEVRPQTVVRLLRGRERDCLDRLLWYSPSGQEARDVLYIRLVGEIAKGTVLFRSVDALMPRLEKRLD